MYAALGAAEAATTFADSLRGSSGAHDRSGSGAYGFKAYALGADPPPPHDWEAARGAQTPHQQLRRQGDRGLGSCDRAPAPLTW